jgi:hypothetical protein
VGSNEHTIWVTAQGVSAGTLARELEEVPGVQVRERSPTDQLALDPASVSLIIAGLGSVNVLITALATMWSARVKGHAAEPAPGSAPTQLVLHLHTDADEIRVTVGRDGTVVGTSAPLPAAVEDITDIHLALGSAAPG